MSAVTDLRGVIRIAKAASIGVAWNVPRIERAEQAVIAVLELTTAANELSRQIGFRIDDPRDALHDRLRAALTPFSPTPPADPWPTHSRLRLAGFFPPRCRHDC